jgi:Family of unknown function (DUF6399)
MPTDESPPAAESAPNPVATLAKGPQHPRDEIASALAQMRSADGIEAPSIRVVGLEANLPESTLRYWIKRVAQCGLEPEVVAFFESPTGVRFLHQLLVALLFVLGLMGGCGPSLLRLFLKLTGLEPLVACSDTTLRTRMKKLLAAVGAWGERVQRELAATMPLRKVSLGLDETFFANMVLVALDAVSGYILLENTSDKRDAKTWNEHVQGSLGGLKVELVQVVGDGATALRKLAEDLLGIPKIDDLWHGQNAISRGTAGPLAARVQQATTILTTAHEVQELVAQGRAAYEQRPHGPGRPPAWEAREACAAHAVQTAEAALKQATEQQAAMQQAIGDLGTILHPVDLATGALQDAAQVETGLQSIFTRMNQIAEQARLGERSRAALRKAARLVPSWVASIVRWNAMVETRLAALALPIAVVILVRNILIPVLYLSRVIRQTRDAARRDELRTVRARLLGVLAEPGGLWRTLPVPLRHTLLALAQDCVDLFQRATGCVEGRNGYLSLHQHHRRGLGPVLLKALTVVHNFVITRTDRTTAAARFFGRAPEQTLFDHLCKTLPLPARPRNRSRHPEEDIFCLAT